MKKVVFFVLGLFVLVFSFSLGRVSAKGDWDCLYGDCGKNNNKFSVMKMQDLFFMGITDKSNIKYGLLSNESGRGMKFMSKKSLVKMSPDSVAFGKIGTSKVNNEFCIAKGYVFKLDLSSYDKYADKDCKPLSGAK